MKANELIKETKKREAAFKKREKEISSRMVQIATASNKRSLTVEEIQERQKLARERQTITKSKKLISYEKRVVEKIKPLRGEARRKKEKAFKGLKKSHKETFKKYKKGELKDYYKPAYYPEPPEDWEEIQGDEIFFYDLMNEIDNISDNFKKSKFHIDFSDLNKRINILNDNENTGFETLPDNGIFTGFAGLNLFISRAVALMGKLINYYKNAGQSYPVGIITPTIYIPPNKNQTTRIDMDLTFNFIKKTK